jgi:transcriptional regulator with XRE-family HTH domain
MRLDTVNFAKRVRAARGGVGYTQADLAKLMGVSRITVANVEAGCIPSLPVYMWLCGWLGEPPPFAKPQTPPTQDPKTYGDA